jgi:hypothetical protein
MATPMFRINVKVFEQVSMGVSLMSQVIDISEVVGYCVHAIWSGTPTGQIITEGSNDGVNFVSVNQQNTAGAAGQHLLNVEHQHYRYVRIRFNRVSGSGLLDCYVSGKQA